MRRLGAARQEILSRHKPNTIPNEIVNIPFLLFFPFDCACMSFRCALPSRPFRFFVLSSSSVTCQSILNPVPSFCFVCFFLPCRKEKVRKEASLAFHSIYLFALKDMSAKLIVVVILIACVCWQAIADARVPHPPALPRDEQDAAQLREKFDKMTIRELKVYLQDRSAKCPGCVERHQLIERAMEVRDVMTEDEYVVAYLTPLEASNSMTPGVLADTLAPQLTPEQMDVIQRAQSDVLCEAPLPNGTVYCHSLTALRQHASTE